eukprot:g16364.t1
MRDRHWATLMGVTKKTFDKDPEKELDDSWLEEELLSFCVEPIDEQQALMSLLEEVSPQSTGEAGAGRHSDLSVEVF